HARLSREYLDSHDSRLVTSPHPGTRREPGLRCAAMPYEDLLLERRGRVAIATLNRPDQLNAFNRAQMADVLAVCEEVRDDDDVWVLVITGAGRGFSAGADLTTGQRPPSTSEGPMNQRLD